ncbi:hypothetical protein BDV18DRAFT_159232 [Aspergillus unguis]
MPPTDATRTGEYDGASGPSSKDTEGKAAALGLGVGLGLGSVTRRPRSHSTSPPSSRKIVTESIPRSISPGPTLERGDNKDGSGRPRRPSILRFADSPTAVPLHFRPPPTSPRLQRSPSITSSTAASPSSPTQTHRRSRPNSLEFKNSREIRPLFLVERHGASKIEDQDEPLPSLPSSRSDSTEDLTALRDENAWESGAHSPQAEIQQKGRESFGSQQDTPTRATFGLPRHLSRKDELGYEFHSPSDLLQEQDRPSTPQDKGIAILDAQQSTPKLSPTKDKDIPDFDLYKGAGFAGVVDAAVAAHSETSPLPDPEQLEKSKPQGQEVDDDARTVTGGDAPTLADLSPATDKTKQPGPWGFASVVDAAVAANQDPKTPEEHTAIPGDYPATTPSDKPASVADTTEDEFFDAMSRDEMTDNEPWDINIPGPSASREVPDAGHFGLQSHGHEIEQPAVELKPEPTADVESTTTEKPSVLDAEKEIPTPTPEPIEKGAEDREPEPAESLPEESSSKTSKKNKKKKKGTSVDLSEQDEQKSLETPASEPVPAEETPVFEDAKPLPTEGQDIPTVEEPSVLDKEPITEEAAPEIVPEPIEPSKDQPEPSQPEETEETPVDAGLSKKAKKKKKKAAKSLEQTQEPAVAETSEAVQELEGNKQAMEPEAESQTVSQDKAVEEPSSSTGDISVPVGLKSAEPTLAEPATELQKTDTPEQKVEESTAATETPLPIQVDPETVPESTEKKQEGEADAPLSRKASKKNKKKNKRQSAAEAEVTDAAQPEPATEPETLEKAATETEAARDETKQNEQVDNKEISTGELADKIPEELTDLPEPPKTEPEAKPDDIAAPETSSEVQPLDVEHKDDANPEQPVDTPFVDAVAEPSQSEATAEIKEDETQVSEQPFIEPEAEGPEPSSTGKKSKKNKKKDKQSISSVPEETSTPDVIEPEIQPEADSQAPVTEPTSDAPVEAPAPVEEQLETQPEESTIEVPRNVEVEASAEPGDAAAPEEQAIAEELPMTAAQKKKAKKDKKKKRQSALEEPEAEPSQPVEGKESAAVPVQETTQDQESEVAKAGIEPSEVAEQLQEPAPEQTPEQPIENVTEQEKAQDTLIPAAAETIAEEVQPSTESQEGKALEVEAPTVTEQPAESAPEVTSLPEADVPATEPVEEMQTALSKKDKKKKKKKGKSASVDEAEPDVAPTTADEPTVKDNEVAETQLDPAATAETPKEVEKSEEPPASTQAPPEAPIEQESTTQDRSIFEPSTELTSEEPVISQQEDVVNDQVTTQPSLIEEPTATPTEPEVQEPPVEEIETASSKKKNKKKKKKSLTSVDEEQPTPAQEEPVTEQPAEPITEAALTAEPEEAPAAAPVEEPHPPVPEPAEPEIQAELQDVPPAEEGLSKAAKKKAKKDKKRKSVSFTAEEASEQQGGPSETAVTESTETAAAPVETLADTQVRAEQPASDSPATDEKDSTDQTLSELPKDESSALNTLEETVPVVEAEQIESIEPTTAVPEAEELEKQEEEPMSAKAKKKAKKDKKRKSKLSALEDEPSASTPNEPAQSTEAPAEEAAPETSEVKQSETAISPAEEDGKENQSHDTGLDGQNDKELTWADNDVSSQVENQQQHQPTAGPDSFPEHNIALIDEKPAEPTTADDVVESQDASAEPQQSGGVAGGENNGVQTVAPSQEMEAVKMEDEQKEEKAVLDSEPAAESDKVSGDIQPSTTSEASEAPKERVEETPQPTSEAEAAKEPEPEPEEPVSAVPAKKLSKKERKKQREAEKAAAAAQEQEQVTSLVAEVQDAAEPAAFEAETGPTVVEEIQDKAQIPEEPTTEDKPVEVVPEDIQKPADSTAAGSQPTAPSSPQEFQDTISAPEDIPASESVTVNAGSEESANIPKENEQPTEQADSDAVQNTPALPASEMLQQTAVNEPRAAELDPAAAEDEAEKDKTMELPVVTKQEDEPFTSSDPVPVDEVSAQEESAAKDETPAIVESQPEETSTGKSKKKNKKNKKKAMIQDVEAEPSEESPVTAPEPSVQAEVNEEPSKEPAVEPTPSDSIEKKEQSEGVAEHGEPQSQELEPTQPETSKEREQAEPIPEATIVAPQADKPLEELPPASEEPTLSRKESKKQKKKAKKQAKEQEQPDVTDVPAGAGDIAQEEIKGADTAEIEPTPVAEPPAEPAPVPTATADIEQTYDESIEVAALPVDEEKNVEPAVEASVQQTIGAVDESKETPKSAEKELDVPEEVKMTEEVENQMMQEGHELPQETEKETIDASASQEATIESEPTAPVSRKLSKKEKKKLKKQGTAEPVEKEQEEPAVPVKDDATTQATPVITEEQQEAPLAEQPAQPVQEASVPEPAPELTTREVDPELSREPVFETATPPIVEESKATSEPPKEDDAPLSRKLSKKEKKKLKKQTAPEPVEKEQQEPIVPTEPAVPGQDDNTIPQATSVLTQEHQETPAPAEPVEPVKEASVSEPAPEPTAGEPVAELEREPVIETPSLPTVDDSKESPKEDDLPISRKLSKKEKKKRKGGKPDEAQPEAEPLTQSNQPEEQTKEKSLELDQAQKTEGADRQEDEAWPPIDWAKGKIDTIDQSSQSSDEAHAGPFVPEIPEFKESAIPEALLERPGETPQEAAKDSKAQAMTTTIERDVTTKDLNVPTTDSALDTLHHAESVKKAEAPKPGKLANIFPNLERGFFRRPSPSPTPSVKDGAEEETMKSEANRDSAIHVSEAPIAKEIEQPVARDSGYVAGPAALAQDFATTRELPQPDTSKHRETPEAGSATQNIPKSMEEDDVFGPTTTKKLPNIKTDFTPKGLPEVPERKDPQTLETPAVSLRRSPSIHGRHGHSDLPWSLEPSQPTKQDDSPAKPLPSTADKEPERPMARSGSPVLDLKPEHVLPAPRPETPVRKFTDTSMGRRAWPTPENETDDDWEKIQKPSLQVSPEPSRLGLKTPEQNKPILRPSSGSARSSTNSLRRIVHSGSGDLRAAALAASETSAPAATPERARQSRPATPQPPAQAPTDLDEGEIASSSSYDPVTDKGKRPIRSMTDVYEGWGETPSSPRSPSRPPSVRHRRSMQHLQELEFRLDHLIQENRDLAAARDAAEDKLRGASLARRKSDQALNTRDADLRDRESELEQLQESVEWFQKEVARLNEENTALTSTNATLITTHKQQLQTVQQTSAREVEKLQMHNASLASEMQQRVKSEIETALRQKNAELRRLREELESARDKVKELQQQISASMNNDVIVFRGEDYFEAACQKLCGHVQQWVLRFSKHSDHRRCRKLIEIKDEKIADRFDNAILDGSDTDMYLGDRVKRRDIFMSVVMTMVWEFVFTRYLFGMDREQRQKLKSLEKQLVEVGPRNSIHRWRATTLTLLAKRQAFTKQRDSDTEAVALEIFDTLSHLLPPPTNVESQLLESLRKVLRVAVSLSLEMRTQLAEYIMLPPLQPEYDTNGDLSRQVFFNASLMNERSGETTSNEELQSQNAIVRVVLFPLVVKKGNDTGEGDEEVVVCPAQVLVAKPGKDKRLSRMVSGDRMSIDARSVHSIVPSSMNMSMNNLV